jgi:flagellar biosynthesis/type III secretory pathway protein FliH
MGREEHHGEEWEKLKAEFDARLEKMKREALRERLAQTASCLWLFPLPGRWR